MIINLRLIPGFAALGALTLLAGCSTGGVSGGSFAKADTDHNSAISVTEFDSFMKPGVFTRVDSNSDGKVTLGEWQAVNPDVHAARFNRADRNRDGGISLAEANAAFDREGSLTKLFKRIDTNHDGSLSQAEVHAFRAVVHAQPGNSPLEKLSHAAKP